MRAYEGDSFSALEEIWYMFDGVWYSPPSCHDGSSQTCPKAETPSAFLLPAISLHVTLLPTEGSGEA